MLTVGLTGNVASGKSEVARLWRAQGVPVVDADQLARDAVAPGTAGLDAVREAFGPGILAPDGSLDRAALRRVVFEDDAARARLEAIVHPRVRALRDAWSAARRAEGERLVVAEIPLLFETGVEDDVDVTVFVDAPDQERLRRMTEGRGLPEAEARAIMAAQMDPARKRRLADVVLDNSGSLEALRRRADAVLDDLRTRAGIVDVRMDLHLHTWGSWDCLSDPEAVLRRARRLGYRRIAITDHNRLDVALRMAEAHPDEIIPGEEVKTAEGIDVIGLYLREAIPKGTPGLETIERIRAQGGIPYLPHPYAKGKGGGGRYAEEWGPLVDVIEVFNARMHPGRLNAPAAALADRLGALRGAGSDSHLVGELGGAWVELPDHPNRPDALLRALESARTGGRTAPHWVHLGSTWAKVRKRLPGAPGPAR
ncbi:MAG: dephospho-CoA kinase [Longimicrobiales bacterium]